jgi:hypothetical protein
MAGTLELAPAALTGADVGGMGLEMLGECDEGERVNDASNAQ